MLVSSKIPVGYIFNKVKFDIAYVTAIGLVVHYLTDRYKADIPELPIAIPAFIGTAISVILSFKLNQSYDRWWEARKVWGSIVNDSRTLILQLQSFVKKEARDEIRPIALRQIAWCYSLGQSLRGLDALKNLNEFIDEKEITDLKSQRNIPLGILQANTLAIRNLKDEEKLDIFSFIQLNNTLVNFSNAMGMAERIKSTVFPLTYRLFLHFFIYVFVITLSISLQDVESYFEMPLLLVMSLSFLILERSATHLQDPFMNRPTDTPVTAIARNIEINLKNLIQEPALPNPVNPSGYYVM